MAMAFSVGAPACRREGTAELGWFSFGGGAAISGSMWPGSPGCSWQGRGEAGFDRKALPSVPQLASDGAASSVLPHA
jgi:hypothetical protein